MKRAFLLRRECGEFEGVAVFTIGFEAVFAVDGEAPAIVSTEAFLSKVDVEGEGRASREKMIVGVFFEVVLGLWPEAE